MAPPGGRTCSDSSSPLIQREGKSYFTLAVGCTGGRHRSVAIVAELSRRLTESGIRAQVRHRDIDR